LREINTKGIDSFPLADVCKPIALQPLLKLATLERLAPKITFFDNINDSQVKKIQETNNLDRLKCVIFDHFLDETFNERFATRIPADGENVRPSLIDLLDHVVPETFNKWRSLAERVENASLKLGDIDFYVKTLFSGNYKKFLDEVFYICEAKCNAKNMKGKQNLLKLKKLSDNCPYSTINKTCII
jgi:hypothetical protein